MQSIRFWCLLIINTKSILTIISSEGLIIVLFCKYLLSACSGPTAEVSAG